MKVSCFYCGVVAKPHICPHKVKRTTNRNRKDNKVYESQEYRKVRKEVLSNYQGICLWGFYVYGRIMGAEITHHIIEVLQDEEQATDFMNLIPLTRAAHEQVHRYYDTDKKKTQQLLKKMLDSFNKEEFELGKYKNEAAELGKI